ncbi:MAG: hypothetical protein R2778_12260 [Saprospiraceae bacterium]
MENSNQFNASRLFTASCFALVTTAFAFAIRAGILAELATEFALSDTQLGYINSNGHPGLPYRNHGWRLVA